MTARRVRNGSRRSGEAWGCHSAGQSSVGKTEGITPWKRNVSHPKHGQNGWARGENGVYATLAYSCRGAKHHERDRKP